MNLSPLQKQRLLYAPKIPSIFRNLNSIKIKNHVLAKQNSNDVNSQFNHLSKNPFLTFVEGENSDSPPLKIGVVFSGGQASGGHNVVTGLFDALKKLNSKSTLYGIKDGPKGIIDNEFLELNAEILVHFRNQGGFDLLGSGRTKIEKPEQFQAAENTVKTLNLDGLVIIGGDDSNTNAAFLAEYFIQNNIKTKVIGVPKTIDGDLKNDYVEVSFGFDTACKVYSETIGNILRDSLSAKKYYFFIKMMGRSASHIALECALQTHPTLTLISEEIAQKKMTLKDITLLIADIISKRALTDKNYGVILIPEGIVEFIPEFKTLIQELNILLSPEKSHAAQLDKISNPQEKSAHIACLLSDSSAQCFNLIPSSIQSQLLLDRDAHGNIQVSKIESERLFIETVSSELQKRKNEGKYKGSFSPQPLFLGYEGRCSLPSNFDSDYCYALGFAAAILLSQNYNGYMVAISNLTKQVEDWMPKGIPLVSMMTLEQRHGANKVVIQKTLVELSKEPFKTFAKHREQWSYDDDFEYPGPIQFFGPKEICDAKSITLTLEHS